MAEPSLIPQVANPSIGAYKDVSEQDEQWYILYGRSAGRLRLGPVILSKSNGDGWALAPIARQVAECTMLHSTIGRATGFEEKTWDGAHRF